MATIQYSSDDSHSRTPSEPRSNGAALSAGSYELRVGLAALDLRLVDRDQLFEALARWRTEPDKSIGQILVELGYLSVKHEEVLEALVESIAPGWQGPLPSALARGTTGPSPSVPSTSAPASSAGVLPSPSGTIHPESKVPVESNPSVMHTYAYDPADESQGEKTQVFAPANGHEFGGLRHQSQLLRERLFAEGGLGQIWLCQQNEQLIRRRVAVKQLKPHLADDQHRRDQFEFEAQVTCGLEHPNVVPVYGLGRSDDGRPYYIMQFVHGELLRETIAEYHNATHHIADQSERDVSLRKLLTHFISVCDTIHYAHSRGILHRDLKPENVKIGRYGQVVVLDWGLALPFDPKRFDLSSDEPSVAGERPKPLANAEEGRFLGTPGYASPEQAAGKLQSMGPRSDVYSLGAVLYCILTGKPPIQGESTTDVIAKAQRGEFLRPRELNHEISKGLEAICLKAMTYAPDKRYRSARALASDIEHWLADAPVTALADTRWQKVRRFARHHRTATIAATSVLAMAALASVLLTLSAQRMIHERDGRTQAFEAIEEALFPADSKQRLTENINPSLRLQHKYESIVDNVFGRANSRDANLARVPAKIALLPHPFEQTLRLYTQAEQQYQRLLEQDPDHPHLNAEYADLLIHRGTAQRAQRNAEASRDDLNAAIDRLKRLVAIHPQPEFEQRLARGYHELASLMMGSGNEEQLLDAETFYQKSRRLRRDLVARYPGAIGVEYRHELAMSDGWLGDLYMSLAKFDQARNAYDVSLKLRKQLHEESPDNWERAFQLARAYNNFVNIYAEYGDPNLPDGDRGQLEKAVEFAEQARQLQLKIVGENPANIDYRSDLSGSNNSLADLLLDLERPNDAAPLIYAAKQLLTELAIHDPNDPMFHSELANTYAILAKYHREQKYEEGVRQALAAAEEQLRNVVLERRDDGTTVENQGRMNEGDFLTRAIIHSLRAETATGEQKAAEIRAALAELDRRTLAGGHGPWRLEHDRGLKALREEPRFREIVAELKQQWRNNKADKSAPPQAARENGAL